MNVFNVTLLLLCAACAGQSAGDTIKWKPNGLVTFGKFTKKLNLYGIGESYRTEAGVYFGGYKPSKGSQDIYSVAYISNDLQEEKYWIFKSAIHEFFKYKNSIYFIDIEGKTFYRVKDEWKEGPLKFNAFSNVVYSDEFVLACHPRSLFKDGGERGGCSAPERKWEIVIDWLNVRPKMCNDKLVIMVFNIRAPFDIVRYNPTNGEEVSRKKINHPVADLCAVHF